MISNLDSIFQAATTPTIPTFQNNNKNRGTGTPVVTGPTIGGGNDIWKTLEDEYGKVDAAFDTTNYDKAAEAEYGNILTTSKTSANSAAAEYTARARQSGGSAEGAGLVKAQALVTGRREVADARMKQLQYDIDQREKGRQLSASIAAQIGGLKIDYLKNLTSFQIATLQSQTQKDVAKMGIDAEKDWRSQALGEQSREFNLDYSLKSLATARKPWSGSATLSGQFTGLDQYGQPFSMNNFFPYGH